MNQTTKTGLIPMANPRIMFPYTKRQRPSTNIFLSAVISKPVPLSVRPFGDLFNPYSKSCSVLCNHPAPIVMRQIIKRIKESKSSETKDPWHDDYSKTSDYQINLDQIPDDLFRRYTDIDSQPMTPTPTKASLQTRTSAGSFIKTRRCLTPEPSKDRNARMKIILDLRRSHSQETIHWKVSSEFSQVQTIETESTTKSVATVQEVKKKLPTSAEKPQPAPPPPPPKVEDPVICINEQDTEDGEMLQRRGKKAKKKIKVQASKTFHLSEDPETQVAALGPDSVNASTRPSLVPNLSGLNLNIERKSEEISELKNSFLTEEAFRTLKTELDIDVLEESFGRYLSRALREAFQYYKPKPDSVTSSMEKTIKKSNAPSSHINMPRKFSKTAARFELPLNLEKLNDMSVLEYLGRYVWVSRQRKQLYKKVFVKYLSKEEKSRSQEEITFTRALEVAVFDNALQDTLGLYGTDTVIATVKALTELDDASPDDRIEFRLWCGIVSFAERFAINESGNHVGSFDELEQADFDTLDRKLPDLKLNSNLQAVFENIRQGHNEE